MALAAASSTSSCAHRRCGNGAVAVAPRRRRAAVRVAAQAAATKLIHVISGPEAEKRAAELRATSWPTWGCDISKFPWSYDERETCYVLEGEVVVTPDGAGEGVRIAKGDVAVFEQGLSCVWDVKKAIRKHYNFG